MGDLSPREADRARCQDSSPECYRCVFFQSLPSGHMQGTFEQANKEGNLDKNRYPNILPSKVLLVLRGRWRFD